MNRAALRELQEEIGYTAKRLDFFLGEVRPFSKYVALQKALSIWHVNWCQVAQGDERYPILVRQVPLKDFECLITSKQMLDASVIAALFLARSFLENADVSVPDMHSDVSGAL